MADVEKVRTNERLKAASGSVFNLATGLLAAAFARMYLSVGADVSSLLWLVVSAGLYYIGYLVLGLLDDEDGA